MPNPKMLINSWFRPGLLLTGLIMGTGYAFTAYWIGSGTHISIAQDLIQTSIVARDRWCAMERLTRHSETEPNNANPALVPYASGLDAIIWGTPAIQSEVIERLPLVVSSGLKERVFIGRHREWGGVDYRLQGIEWFKVSRRHTPERFVSVFTNVPDFIVRPLIQAVSENPKTDLELVPSKAGRYTVDIVLPSKNKCPAPSIFDD
jgi:hypothetical protein